MYPSRQIGLHLGEWTKTTITLIVVLLGQADVALAQCPSNTIPIVVSVLVTLAVACIVFLVILYWLRKRWKKPEDLDKARETNGDEKEPAYGKDYTPGAGFDNPLVVDRKENGKPRVEEAELSEVVTQPNTSQPPQPKTNHEGYQERAVDVEGLPLNGRSGNGDQIQTIVLSKSTPTNGFNIVADNDGNMFVRDIRKDGPASGKLMEGDILESVTVFYEGISYEDALNVLSFAAPYKVAISVVRGKNHLMPGVEGNKADPFVQELQQQLEKRGSPKKDAEEQPAYVDKEKDKPASEDVAEDHKKRSSSSSSSSSSSEDEQAQQSKIGDEDNVSVPPTKDDKEGNVDKSQEHKDEDSMSNSSFEIVDPVVVVMDTPQKSSSPHRSPSRQRGRDKAKEDTRYSGKASSSSSSSSSSENEEKPDAIYAVVRKEKATTEPSVVAADSPQQEATPAREDVVPSINDAKEKPAGSTRHSSASSTSSGSDVEDNPKKVERGTLLKLENSSPEEPVIIIETPSQAAREPPTKENTIDTSKEDIRESGKISSSTSSEGEKEPKELEKVRNFSVPEGAKSSSTSRNDRGGRSSQRSGSSTSSSSSSGRKKRFTKKRSPNHSKAERDGDSSSSDSDSKHSSSGASSESSGKNASRGRVAKRKKFFESLSPEHGSGSPSSPRSRSRSPSESPHVTTDRQGNLVVREGDHVRGMDLDDPEDMKLLQMHSNYPHTQEKKDEAKDSSSSTTSDEIEITPAIRVEESGTSSSNSSLANSAWGHQKTPPPRKSEENAESLDSFVIIDEHPQSKDLEPEDKRDRKGSSSSSSDSKESIPVEITSPERSDGKIEEETLGGEFVMVEKDEPGKHSPSSSDGSDNGNYEVSSATGPRKNIPEKVSSSDSSSDSESDKKAEHGNAKEEVKQEPEFSLGGKVDHHPVKLGDDDKTSTEEGVAKKSQKLEPKSRSSSDSSSDSDVRVDVRRDPAESRPEQTTDSPKSSASEASSSDEEKKADKIHPHSDQEKGEAEKENEQVKETKSRKSSSSSSGSSEDAEVNESKVSDSKLEKRDSSTSSDQEDENSTQLSPVAFGTGKGPDQGKEQVVRDESSTSSSSEEEEKYADTGSKPDTEQARSEEMPLHETGRLNKERRSSSSSSDEENKLKLTPIPKGEFSTSSESSDDDDKDTDAVTQQRSDGRQEDNQAPDPSIKEVVDAVKSSSSSSSSDEGDSDEAPTPPGILKPEKTSHQETEEAVKPEEYLQKADGSEDAERGPKLITEPKVEFSSSSGSSDDDDKVTDNVTQQRSDDGQKENQAPGPSLTESMDTIKSSSSSSSSDEVDSEEAPIPREILEPDKTVTSSSSSSDENEEEAATKDESSVLEEDIKIVEGASSPSDSSDQENRKKNVDDSEIVKPRSSDQPQYSEVSMSSSSESESEKDDTGDHKNNVVDQIHLEVESMSSESTVPPEDEHTEEEKIRDDQSSTSSSDSENGEKGINKSESPSFEETIVPIEAPKESQEKESLSSSDDETDYRPQANIVHEHENKLGGIVYGSGEDNEPEPYSADEKPSPDSKEESSSSSDGESANSPAEDVDNIVKEPNDSDDAKPKRDEVEQTKFRKEIPSVLPTKSENEESSSSSSESSDEENQRPDPKKSSSSTSSDSERENEYKVKPADSIPEQQSHASSSSEDDGAEKSEEPQRESEPGSEHEKEKSTSSSSSSSSSSEDEDTKTPEMTPSKKRDDIVLTSGWRKAVKLLDLIKARLVLESTVKKLEFGEVTEEDVQEGLKQYLIGDEPIAGLLIMDTGEKMSLLKASEKGIIRRGTALSLLEAQAATGSIIDPVTGKKMPVKEAVEEHLVDRQFKAVLERAERAVHGYTSRLSPEPLSLFEAMEKKLVVENHAIRLLEAQIATGGIIDPKANHRIPVDVAVERGLFDERLQRILEDPSDDTKGFFDPNTKENLTYLDLMQRCILDRDTNLRLLPLFEGESKRQYSQKHKSQDTGGTKSGRSSLGGGETP